MSTITAILMCHGKQSRMGEGYTGFKQLVPILGEPVAQRTGRMLREMADRVLLRFVAPASKDWQLVTNELGADRIETPNSLFLAAIPDVIPKGLTPDRLLILCGDVIFSPDILGRLISSKEPVAFAGRFVPNIYTGRSAGELFGLSVDGRHVFTFVKRVRAMVDGLADMRKQVESVAPDQVEAVMERNLRLWMLLHMFEDARMAEVIECAWTDYIDDIDGPDDLERLPKIEEVIRRRQEIAKRVDWVTSVADAR